MNLFVATLICGIVLCGISPGAHCVERMALNATAKAHYYTFQNSGDSGYLTSVGGRDFVVTDGWKDIPSQKWIQTKAMIYTSYMLKSMSDGIDSKVALSSVVEGNGLPIVKKKSYSNFLGGMSSSLYWDFVKGDAGGNFFLIKNTSNELCLESRRAGQVVGVSTCTAAANQLWAVRGH